MDKLLRTWLALQGNSFVRKIVKAFCHVISKEINFKFEKKKKASTIIEVS